MDKKNTKKDDTAEKKNKKSFFSTKGLIKTMWALFALGIISIGLLFILIANGVIGYMPDIKDLENPIDKYASQVYSSDGVVLGTYSQAKNNRVYSDYNDIPQHLIDALIATEDVRYYDHSGIDFKALGRVIGKTVLTFNPSGGGGSTISQQLAKLLYSPESDGLVDRALKKPIEWVIAVQLERHYTKDEIINLYLTQFDFLNNAVGIKSAAQVYFNKTPQELTIEEAATLVGMCKNPSYYNPIRAKAYERTRLRRNTVLEQMEKYNYLTKQECDSLKAIELTTDFRRADHKDGLAPYMRENLRLMMNAKKPERKNYKGWQEQQYHTDSINWETNPLYGWCSKNKKPNGDNYNLATDGLKIYTTIDSRMQKYAEESMDEHMGKTVQPAFDKEKKGRSYAPFAYSERKRADEILERAMKQTDRYRNLKKNGLSDTEIKKAFDTPAEMKVFSWKGEIDTTMTPIDSIRYHMQFLRSAFTAIDTHTGHVKAYVGGIDFKYFQYDMVSKGRRQIGSIIKPFLYALSMEEGATPCDQMLHVEQTLITENGKPWTPRNANRKLIGEMVSIKWGLQNSDNWVTAYLMGRTSPYTFARMLGSFGITGKIAPVVSMCLGTHDVSVGEMASAYTAFANKGIRATPMFVTHIEDAHGNIISTFSPQLHEVFSERTYVKMIDMLRSVIDGGTGGRVRRNGVEGQLGGKTGTTQNNSDGWFMCFSPSLSTACWVGGEDMSIRFDRMSEGQGAAMALPINALFFKKLYADGTTGYTKNDKFEVIDGISPCDRAIDAYEDDSINSSVTIDNMFNE